MDERTIRAVRTFVEEKSPGKAVNILLSEGCHDPKDPAVLHKLQALHPAAPPSPEARAPTSRRPSTSGMTWKADETGSGRSTE